MRHSVHRLKGRPAATRTDGLDRREALKVAGALATLGLLGSGCSPGPTEEPLRPDQVALPLEGLTEGRRVIVVVDGNPVELMRAGDQVTARMLRCTHVGCVVRWRADAHAYVCPCHEGRYDENGAVLAGPPPLPLRTVPVAIRKGRVVVG